MNINVTNFNRILVNFMSKAYFFCDKERYFMYSWLYWGTYTNLCPSMFLWFPNSGVWLNGCESEVSKFSNKRRVTLTSEQGAVMKMMTTNKIAFTNPSVIVTNSYMLTIKSMNIKVAIVWEMNLKIIPDLIVGIKWYKMLHINATEWIAITSELNESSACKITNQITSIIIAMMLKTFSI